MAAVGTVESRVAAVMDLYRHAGRAEYSGEAVSQYEHAAQSAELAQSEGHPADVVCAAFLHDVGHLCAPSEARQMDDLSAEEHDRVGADFLGALGFPERTCRLVARHVAAKRYMTFKDPAYARRLSDASRVTLVHQGGPMSAAEASRFEGDPLFSLALELRTWDEAAKVPVQPVQPVQPRQRSADPSAHREEWIAELLARTLVA